MRKLNWIFFIAIAFQMVSSYCFAQSESAPSRKQVKFFFPGARLADDFKFSFPGKFKEIVIRTKDSSNLSALLFKADSSKGVILYLHGNTDALDKWGGAAQIYTALNYDVFMLDYRGYGKSQGNIRNEAQLYSDVQDTYSYVKTIYPEDNIIVLGYSIGTGPAAMLAAYNRPKKLILQAPYYSLPDAMRHLRPSFDTTNIAFHFNIDKFLPKTSAPVIIFHGDADKMFYYGSSLKLKNLFKPSDELITLKGAGHSYMDRNKDYLDALIRILK